MQVQCLHLSQDLYYSPRTRVIGVTHETKQVHTYKLDKIQAQIFGLMIDTLFQITEQ